MQPGGRLEVRGWTGVAGDAGAPGHPRAEAAMLGCGCLLGADWRPRAGPARGHYLQRSAGRILRPLAARNRAGDLRRRDPRVPSSSVQPPRWCKRRPPPTPSSGWSPPARPARPGPNRSRRGRHTRPGPHDCGADERSAPSLMEEIHGLRPPLTMKKASGTNSYQVIGQLACPVTPSTDTLQRMPSWLARARASTRLRAPSFSRVRCR